MTEIKTAENVLKKHLEIAMNPSQWPEKYDILYSPYNPYIEAMEEYKSLPVDSRQGKYQVGFPDYDVVGKFFEEISIAHKDKDFLIETKHCSQSNDINHYLIFDNRLFAAVIERRTEFNDLEYTFINRHSASLPVDSNVENESKEINPDRFFNKTHDQLGNEIVQNDLGSNVDAAAEKKYTILDLQEVWDAAKAGENVPILYGKIGSSRYKEKYPKLNDFLK